MSDIIELHGPTQEPASGGPAKQLVIFCHGVGADGNDLIGLGDALAPHLPDTMFVAPNAPERCTANPMGYQWFPIPHMDGSTWEQAQASLATSVEMLNAFLDDTAKGARIGPERTVLVGFSQGTMMSLHVAPRRAHAVAGIVGFSGRLLLPETLAAEAVSKPPVLLVHGDMDEVVPMSEMPAAEAALKAAGFDVATHVSPGIGHGIAPDGLGLALGFIKEKLG